VKFRIGIFESQDAKGSLVFEFRLPLLWLETLSHRWSLFLLSVRSIPACFFSLLRGTIVVKKAHAFVRLVKLWSIFLQFLLQIDIFSRTGFALMTMKSNQTQHAEVATK